MDKYICVNMIRVIPKETRGQDVKDQINNRKYFFNEILTVIYNSSS